jgi:dTDP-6-deoxy-L-talose 4-dehydrogenase (NAD+)
VRIAVTGASGFIGRHAVRELAARGAEVIAISRHPDPAASDAIVPVAMDIASVAGDAYARIGRPDALLHLAWGGLPNYGAASHLEIELPRQLAFLGACAAGGLPHLVVAGTCLEYGMQSGCLEESLQAAPTTAYGKAKDQLHRSLLPIAASNAMRLTWARLFYLFGPGQAPSSLYAQLQAAVAGHAREFAMSPGDQLRDFLPVEVAVRDMVELALDGRDAGTVNVCSGEARSVESWVRTWLSDWGVEMDLALGVHRYPDYEPHAFWGSTARLRALLGAP